MGALAAQLMGTQIQTSPQDHALIQDVAVYCLGGMLTLGKLCSYIQ